MDLIIQQTDYDALSSKLASIQKKYLPPGPLVLGTPGNETATTTEVKHLSNDQIVQFYRDIAQIYSDYYHALKSQSRRVFGKVNKAIDSSFPVMNYGTYLRTLAIDTSILNFITRYLITSKQTHKQFQIVNLGAGSDLRMVQYLSMFNSTSDPDKPQLLKFVDLDFKPAVDLKNKVLEGARARARASTGEQLTTYLSDPRYALLACDLRDTKATLDTLRRDAGLDPQIPTIFISECVLCYMTQQDSQNLIDEIVREYSGGKDGGNSTYLWVSYDPIGGEAADDKFGKIMRANLLESRNLDMPTLLTFNSKQSYAGRWSSKGGSISNNDNNNSANVQTDIVDMWEFLNTMVSNVEQRRLQGLQFLDEVEELKIMQSHYVLLNARWS